MTPFSPRALDRGLAGTLVALARQGHAPMTPPKGATEILKERGKLDFVARGPGAGRLPTRPRRSRRPRRLRQRCASGPSICSTSGRRSPTNCRTQGVQLQYQIEKRARPSALLYEFLNPELKKLPHAAPQVPGEPLDARRGAERQPLGQDAGQHRRGGRRVMPKPERPAPRPDPPQPGRHDLRPRLAARPAEPVGHRRRPGPLDGRQRGGPRAAAGREAQAAAEPADAQALRPAARQRGPDRRRRTGITAWQFPEWFITQDVGASDGGTDPVTPAGPPQGADEGQVHRRRQEEAPGRADPLRPRLPQGPHRRHRLVSASPTEGKPPCRRQLWIDERGTSGDMAEIAIRCECGLERAPDATRRCPARWGTATAAGPGWGRTRGRLRRAEPAAGPPRQQRLLPADHERDLAARPQRVAGEGGQPGLGELPRVRR